MSTINASYTKLISLLRKRKYLLTVSPREVIVTYTFLPGRISFKVVGTAASAVTAP
ncbi:MAG: hypothetical protein ACOYO1_01905 [Bacteroidales bacterium]